MPSATSPRTYPVLAIVIAFAIGMLGLQEAGTAGVEAASASCAYGEWEPLRVLRGLPEGSVMRSPSLSFHPSGGFALGMDVPELDHERPLERLPWIGLRLDGKRIPPPAGDRFHYMMPRAAADGRGRLHAVWGHDDTLARPTPYEVTGRYPTSLWYSVYHPRDGWDEPTLLLASLEHSRFVGWDPLLGRIGADDDGRAHVVSNFGLDIAHFVVADGEIVHRTLLGEGRAIHPGLETIGDTVYVAYSASPARFGGNTHVFLLRSTDLGETWGDPLPIGDTLPGRVDHVHVLRGRPGFLHLVWADGLSWNKGREIVRHVRLARATGEWTETPPLRSHGRLMWLRAAVDTCGTLHVSYIDWSEGPDPHGRLAYARWTDRWLGPLHPFPEFAAWNDALAGTGSELSLVLPGQFLESGKEPTDRSWTTVMSSLSVQGEPD